MALNWVMIDPIGNPVPLPNETIIQTVEAAEVTLTIPDALPSGSSTAGGSGGETKLKEIGKIWLTDQRVRAPDLVHQTRDN